MYKNSFVSRRSVTTALATFVSLIWTSGVRKAFAQLNPLYITIIRDELWPYTGSFEPSRCTFGKMWISDSGFSTGIGNPDLQTVELPDRRNFNNISHVPEGDYTLDMIRDDGTLGWRVQIAGIPGRDSIQIHVGNFPEQIEGCILVGTSRTSNIITRVRVRNDENRDDIIEMTCGVGGSVNAMNILRDRYGNNNSRQINIRIRS